MDGMELDAKTHEKMVYAIARIIVMREQNYPEEFSEGALAYKYVLAELKVANPKLYAEAEAVLEA